MRKSLFVAGIAVILFAALPMSSFGAGRDFGEIKSPDGVLSFKVLELHDEHGVAYLQGKLKNVSDRELKNLTLVITAYEGAENSTTIEVEFDEIMPGQLRIFEEHLQGIASKINKFEIDYRVAEESAY